jgi:hypothetical protein
MPENQCRFESRPREEKQKKQTDKERERITQTPPNPACPLFLKYLLPKNCRCNLLAAKFNLQQIKDNNRDRQQEQSPSNRVMERQDKVSI